MAQDKKVKNREFGLALLLFRLTGPDAPAATRASLLRSVITAGLESGAALRII